jgi:hypothetical protein
MRTCWTGTPSVKFFKADHLCRGCGKRILDGRTQCGKCAVSDSTERLVKAAAIGRQTANGPEAQLKRTNTQRQNALAQHSWKASDQAAWLTEACYLEKVQPLLAQVSTSAIARRISVSRWYAGRIREGYRPHPRHWLSLAKLVGAEEGFFLEIEKSNPHLKTEPHRCNPRGKILNVVQFS